MDQQQEKKASTRFASVSKMKLAHKKRKRHQHNEQCEKKVNKDTLSDLPDCVLLHIMSFLNAKDVVQTCILSTRYQHLWKHIPTLRLSSSDFNTLEGFTEFVNQFLSLRNSSTALNALDFLERRSVQPNLLEKVVRYATSHNVNRVRLSYDIPHIPPSLLSCNSLTSLDLRIPKLPKEQPICILSTMLLNLSICTDYYFEGYSEIQLFTPNLCTFAFIGKGSPILKFNGSSLSSIKQFTFDADVPLYDHASIKQVSTDVDVSLSKLYECTKSILILFDFIGLRDLVNIESLTLSLAILQVLSSTGNLDVLLKSEVMAPSWYNLKSLKVKLPKKYRYFSTKERDFIAQLTCDKWKENANLRRVINSGSKPYSYISDRFIDFLLQNSPLAKLDILFPDMPCGSQEFFSFL